jgi:hypothetical protein
VIEIHPVEKEFPQLSTVRERDPDAAQGASGLQVPHGPWRHTEIGRCAVQV